MFVKLGRDKSVDSFAGRERETEAEEIFLTRQIAQEPAKSHQNQRLATNWPVSNRTALEAGTWSSVFEFRTWGRVRVLGWEGSRVGEFKGVEFTSLLFDGWSRPDGKLPKARYGDGGAGIAANQGPLRSCFHSPLLLRFCFSMGVNSGKGQSIFHLGQTHLNLKPAIHPQMNADERRLERQGRCVTDMHCRTRCRLAGRPAGWIVLSA